MSGFYWYNIVSILILITYIFSSKLHFFSLSFYHLINNYSLIFHFSFLSYFIYRITKNTINKFIFWTIFFVIMLSVLIILIYNNNSKSDFIAFAISNLGLIIFCIFYYYYLFKELPSPSLLNEPSFWIITGIFLCMVLHVPISSIHGYLTLKINKDIIRVILSISSLSYAFMHLFFVKAFLCSINHRSQ